ncbi:unnamed protein product [Ambrosiozyma monospora]|uniref:Unnamed protein product n=1 Tax=Ambrosiozyma monospora TaxID=43982 RepID=A0ACB5TB14_AMBMO|nr:unnamed protein product [Ambrosiozyma monospora]
MDEDVSDIDFEEQLEQEYEREHLNKNNEEDDYEDEVVETSNNDEESQMKIKKEKESQLRDSRLSKIQQMNDNKAVFESDAEKTLKSQILLLCTALGGLEITSGEYQLGSDALACLKDIKKWIRIVDDEKHNWDNQQW